MFLRLHRARIRIAATAAMGTCLLLLCACTRQDSTRAIPTETPAPARTPTAAQVTSTAPDAPNSEPTAIAEVRSDPDGSGLAPAGSVADLTIQAQASHQPTLRGETVYTLTISNLGPEVATGIVVTDLLPPGATPFWTQTARPLCGRHEGAVSCDLGDLQGHDTVTITLDLSLRGSETLITGTQLAGVALEFSAPVCTFRQENAQSTIVCHIARLESGAEIHLPVALNLAADVKTTLGHTATVKGNEGDGDLSNNRVKSVLSSGTPPILADTPDHSAAELILQAEGPRSVTAGQPFTYTFTVTNRGAMDASHVAFQDTLPPATDLQSFQPDSPPCARHGDIFTCHVSSPLSGQLVTVTMVITGTAEQAMSLSLDPLAPGWPICAVIQERSYLQLLQCSLGTLQQGEAAQVQMVLIARGVQARTMINTATVVAEEDELVTIENTATTTITVQMEADVAVIPKQSKPMIDGVNVNYTLYIANVGPSDANDVVLTDSLPPGTTVVSATVDQGEGCKTNASHSLVTCRIGRLDNGETASASVVIVVDHMTDAFTHIARVRAKPTDPNHDNNEWTESILIKAD